MTNKDVVKKLVGEIMPVGSSEIDALRFENLKEMCTLVNALVTEIDKVACEQNSSFGSVAYAGRYAADFLTNTIGIKE
jgi:hypothetical protein